MAIVLPPELEQLVQRQLERGPYQTPLEVLLAGVQLLEHRLSLIVTKSTAN